MANVLLSGIALVICFVGALLTEYLLHLITPPTELTNLLSFVGGLVFLYGTLRFFGWLSLRKAPPPPEDEPPPPSSGQK